MKELRLYTSSNEDRSGISLSMLFQRHSPCCKTQQIFFSNLNVKLNFANILCVVCDDANVNFFFIDLVFHDSENVIHISKCRAQREKHCRRPKKTVCVCCCRRQNSKAVMNEFFVCALSAQAIRRSFFLKIKFNGLRE